MIKMALVYLFIMLVAGCSNLSQLSNTESTSLNLSRSGLTEIPEEVFSMKQLKVLKLYGNKIDSISPKIAQLENLEKLYIGKNKITYFPPEIGLLKHLKLLSAQYNDIKYLTSAIGRLENLEQLILNQNQLIGLPVEIGKLVNLKVLQLRFNWISFIPEEIGNCTKLEFVYLTRNNLTSLPASFGKLTRLKELGVSNAGSLVELPESLCYLRMLELLEIDNFTAIPPCLLVLKTNRLRIIQL